MQLDRRSVITLTFVIISLGSAVYLSIASINYLRLYPALDEIQSQMTYQVSKMTFVQGQASVPPSLMVDVIVGNPSDYSGLTLSNIQLRLFFYSQSNRSMSLFENPVSLNASQALNANLDPNSLHSVSLTVQMTSQQADMLSLFNNQNPGQVMAEVFLRVDLITFLVSVTGSVDFTRTQDIPLSLA